LPSGELLTPFQKKILKAFTAIEESQAFYLTGGTALSVFHLAHRLSEDFDLFTSDKPLISIVARKFTSKLETLAIQVREIRNFSSFWEAVATEATRVSRFSSLTIILLSLGNRSRKMVYGYIV